MSTVQVPDLHAPEFNRAFPPYDTNFARVEFERGMDYYGTRIRAMNFVGHERVLDAACGVGQWTLALAQYNREVVGADFSQNRLAIGRRVLAANPGVSNVRFVRSDVHRLPFPAESFDAIFCYGVLMFLDERRAMAEFSRVLRPGGQIYICANGFGWSLSFIWKRGLLKRDPIALALGVKGLADTWLFKRLLGRNPVKNTYLTRNEINGIMRESGIEPRYVGGEGSYRAAAGEPFAPIYPSTYLGCDCILEWVGRKAQPAR